MVGGAARGEREKEQGSGLLVVVLFWRLQIVSHESFESYESNEFNSIELSSKRSLSLSFRLSPNSNEGRCQPVKEVHDDDDDDDDGDDDDDDDDANEILL